MLKLQSVTKSYADKIAVKNLSFEVSRGEIFGILGPNGAGKTSTIRMICGITLPDSGTIEFLGRPMNEELQSKIGYLPEERGLYKKMKVGDVLLYFAQLKGLSRAQAKARIAHWAKRFEAEAWLKKKVDELSKGMQQKVQFMSVLLHEPELLILDEPFSGLDPINSELMMDVILEFKEAGKAILFSTHRMEQVEKICDAIVLINNGEAILNGKVREVKKSYGKNRIHLDFEGDDSFLQALLEQGKVEVTARSPKSVELKLLSGTTSREILATASERAEITRFELAEPSLREIFIMRVSETLARHEH